MNYREDIRNIALLPTLTMVNNLVDQLLSQSTTLDEHSKLEDRAMDSNAIERMYYYFMCNTAKL